MIGVILGDARSLDIRGYMGLRVHRAYLKVHGFNNYV